MINISVKVVIHLVYSFLQRGITTPDMLTSSSSHKSKAFSVTVVFYLKVLLKSADIIPCVCSVPVLFMSPTPLVTAQQYYSLSALMGADSISFV